MGHSQPKFIIKNKSVSRKGLEGATNEENRTSLLRSVDFRLLTTFDSIGSEDARD
jgi:hypothetical protein